MKKKSFADIVKDMDALQERKAAAKMPEWADAEGLEFPGALCLEQCSSSATAIFKASLLPEGARIADLTGGLGVDSWAFAARAEAVLHIERNPELSAAAGRNFQRLGTGNISTLCTEILPQTAEEWIESLRGFHPDWIYMDPARRDGCGRKVFLLEDCSPDVLTLIPLLRPICSRFMIKLSPMADISMLCEKLPCREIHIVSLAGEVKELLCIIDSAAQETTDIVVDDVAQGECLRFTAGEETAAGSRWSDADALSGSYLLEPAAALLKAGAFKLPCQRFGIGKLDVSTHLYTSAEPIPSPLFKTFRISEVLPLNKASMKDVGKRYPRAEVTARNIPMTSDELRVRTGCRTGSSTHIFGCTIRGARYLLVTEKI